MSKVFRLTTMKTGPIALSTKEGFVHFGLYGITVVCTEALDDDPVPKVEVKRYNFCKDAGILNDPLLPEIAKAFGLKMEDIAILNQNGNEKLSAEQMCASMKASCRLLSSLGNVIEFFNYNIIWQVNFASLYTKPVENMGELDAIDTNFRERLSAEATKATVLKNLSFKTSSYCKFSSAVDLSLVPVGRTSSYSWDTTPVTVDNLYKLVSEIDGRRYWDITEPNDRYGSHGFSATSPRKDYTGAFRDPLFTGVGLEVAYIQPSPMCKANGRRGAEVGLGRDFVLNEGVGRALSLTCKKENGEQKWSLAWSTYSTRYETDKDESLFLSNLWSLPTTKIPYKAFETIPSVSKLAGMLDVLKPVRYGKPCVDATATLSRGELASVMFGILYHLNPNDADLKAISDNGYITVADAESILGNLVARSVQENRKVDANIEMAAELCKSTAMISDNGAAFSPSGEPIDVDGVKFNFFPITFQGKSGCYPKLVSISEEVLRDGAIISIPSVGEVVDSKGNAKNLPVVSLTTDFCSDKVWRTAIRGVVLPASIVQLVGRDKTTSDGVFSDFNKLELIDMSACTNLKLIGKGAISNCPHLHNIVMPDVKAEEGYTIHEQAFRDLPSVGSLKIRALDIMNNAFVSVSIYSLDLDAMNVKSNAFGRGVVVEGDITLGESFKEIGTSGMSGLCNGKNISVRLPNILTLGNSALMRDIGTGTKGGTLELGENISSFGDSAIAGWENVVINAKGGSVVSGALDGIGSVKVHANTRYDNEAVKSVPQDKITYFEGEEMSDYRKEAASYLAVYSAFIAENGGTIQQYLDNTMPMDAVCMETELPSLVSIIGSEPALTGSPKAFFASGIVDGSLTFTNTSSERAFIEDTIMWVDIAKLRTLMTITKSVPINLVNLYSNAELYGRCEKHEVVHRSDNLIIDKILYVTADFRTEVNLYTVTLKENGNTYLFMENGCGRNLGSVQSVGDLLGIDMGDVDSYTYKEVPGFQMTCDTEESGDNPDLMVANTCNAPFLAPGDYVKSNSPSLLFESMSGNKDTFKKYLKTLAASSVILSVPSGYVLYQPLEKWKITISCGKKDTNSVRVDERQTAVSLPTFCKELVALKCSTVKAITDPTTFVTYAEQAIHPKTVLNTNFKKVLEAFADAKEKATGSALPLSKALFDSITQYGAYIMSVHSGTGTLASDNNLTLSKETEQRRLLADGTYLQCFVAARITKGKQMTKDALTDGSRVAYRGGKGQIWYRIYQADKGGTPLATYISSYGVDELLTHLKSFDFSSDNASDIPYGTLVDKSRFIFDSKTMPTFFENLMYFKGGDGADRMKARVGCALDRFTGRWYMVASNIANKDDSSKSKSKAEKMQESMSKLYVLFPISNIAFASAVMLGLTGTQSTSTRDYLIDLLDALRVANSNSSTICRYKEACSELAKDSSEFSTDKPDRKRIMQLTDFFLAPCLG